MRQGLIKRHQWVLLLVLASPGVFAVSNGMVTVDDLSIGTTTNYTISFDTTGGLNGTNAFGGDGIAILTGSGGPDFSSVALVSLSGGSITGSITAQSTQNFTITLNGAGAASPGTTITIVVSGVVNPGTVGQGPDYTINTADFEVLPPNVETETFAGNVYTGSDAPVVQNPFQDQNLEERNGQQVIVADLNTVFDDGDGDVMTFSVVNGHDTAVTEVFINGNELSLNPIAGGSTDVTIQATASDGTASDTFEVTVLGELENPVVTPANLDAGATTNYSFSFTPDVTLQAGQFVALISDPDDGTDHSGSSVVSISGGSGLTAQAFQPPSSQATSIEITGGSATTSDTVTIEIAGMVNPGAAGLAPDYTLRVFTTPAVVQLSQGTAPGSVFKAVGEPTVTAAIANQNLNEALGETFVVSDLNSVFTDGDGDALSFSVVAGHDTDVVDVSVNANELTVTPVGPGTTTVTIRASDLPAGEGTVDDVFDVVVIGLMEQASWTPNSFDSGVINAYELQFTSSSDFGQDHFIIISNDALNGPDYSAATLGSLTANGAPLSANISAQTADVISVEVTGGAATVGDAIVLSLNGVMNPMAGGTGPDYVLRLFRLMPPVTGDLEQAYLPGHDFVSGDLIFGNGFEASQASPNAVAKALVQSMTAHAPWMPQPLYLESEQQYVFMGHWLSRDVGVVPRAPNQVKAWFEEILRSNQPWDDWDGDGVTNIDDAAPFDPL